MKKNLLRFGLLLMVLLVSSVTKAGDFKDFKLDLTNGNLLTADEISQQSNFSFGITVADDGSITRVAADAAGTNAILSGNYQSKEHGWTNFKATMPVNGPVKISMGTCQWGGDVTVKDASGTTITTMNTNNGACFHNDKTNNIVSCLYKGTEATTLTVEGGKYTPYFAVEAVDPADLISDITFTYSLGDAAAEGIVPTAEKVEIGASYTIPTNKSLYLAGSTLTGWTDGSNIYKIGESITAPNENVTLTPVFTKNTKTLAARTAPVELLYYLGKLNGAPVINYQGQKGILVTQTIVDGETIDVKIDLDGTSGKINNSRNDKWAQVNSGSIFNVPSCKGAKIELEAYNAITTTTIDGQKDYTSGKTICQTMASTSENVAIVIGDGSYYSYVKITLPVVETAKSYTNEVASVVWPFNNATDYATNYTQTPDKAFSLINVNVGDMTVSTKASSVTLDSEGKGMVMTQVTPTTNTKAVEWSIKPNKGLTFTPTSVSAYTNRFGTDAKDCVTVTAKLADGTTVNLGTFTAQRDSKAQADDKYGQESNFTDHFDITLTADQQAKLTSTDCFTLNCTVGVATNKQVGFADVHINGLLNGTVQDVEQFTLETAAVPAEGGNISVYPSGNKFDKDTNIKVTATKNFGYQFENWTDAEGKVVSTENVYTFDLTENTSLKANFKKLNTYALNYKVEGGAKDYMVSLTPAPTVVDGKNMYEAGTEVTLNASSNEIITFNNWDNGETAAEIKVTMDGDKNLTASYAAKDYIVAWDFFKEGNNGRAADFAAEDNDAVQLVLRDADGNTYGWLDKSNAKGGYEGQDAGVNWTKTGELGKTYWQTKFNATAFTDIKVKSSMAYNYNAYKTYDFEYSLNGTDWTKLGSFNIPGAKNWTTNEFSLPADANNQAEVYVRWIADKTSAIDGTQSANDGIAISGIYITGTAKLFDDGTAPKLTQQVPAIDGTNASANGKIVLTFDEKVKLTDKAKATLTANAKSDLNTQELTGVVSGKTITFAYKSLSYATAYSFYLAPGSVADLTDNVINEAITFNFTTKEKPAVSKALYDFIVPTDGDFKAALAAAAKRADTSKRFRIFIKQGDYKIPADASKTKTGNDKKTYPDPTTYLTTPNVSIIGEGMENTSLTNTVPNVEADNGFGPANVLEGIGNGDVLDIEGNATNTYFQDIKFYSSMGDKKGRDIVLNDKSNKTICKNVNLWAFQDTYVSNSDRSRFYFEGGILRGNTDFLCGKGDVYYNNVDLLMCGTGYLAVPSNPTKYGYIFKDCTIKDGSANKGINGKYTLGRPWGKGTPIALFIDTKMEVIPSAAGWSEMSGGYPKRFAEYNSTTATGTTIDLSGRKQVYDAYDAKNGDVYTNRRNETAESPVLTAEEASFYTIANVMGAGDDWDPTAATEQASAPTNVKITDNELTWDNSNYALLWAVCKDGKVVDFTIEPTYTVDDASATWSVRAANEMGGLGEATVATTGTGIEEIANATDSAIKTSIYTVDGIQLGHLQKGINIIVKTFADGSKKTSKVIIK